MSPPKSILIVLMGSIGDVVRGLPLATRIKKHWPDTTVTWAIEPKSKGIIEGHPAVDRLITFDRPKGWPAFRSFIRELRTQEYDVVLDLQRHFKSGYISRASRAKRRIGFHRRDGKEFNWLFQTETVPAQPPTVSKIRHYQKFGDQLGLPPAELDFALPLDESLITRARELIARGYSAAGIAPVSAEKQIVLVIGSSWTSKNWPVARYVELIPILIEKGGLSPILIGGSSEISIAAQILAGADRYPIVNLVARTSLLETAAILKVVRAAVGPDSGSMHIAAAVGTPVVSLWGPTDPMKSGPIGSEDYMLVSNIGCSPCYRKRCPGLDSMCIAEIPALAVMMQLKRIIEKRA